LHTHSERLEAVLRAAALVPDCLEVQRAHAQGGSGNKVVNTKVLNEPHLPSCRQRELFKPAVSAM
jgi:hypothetical protein